MSEAWLKCTVSKGMFPDEAGISFRAGSGEELVECLPLVFRTLRFSKPTERELRNLADKIRHIRR